MHTELMQPIADALVHPGSYCLIGARLRSHFKDFIAP